MKRFEYILRLAIAPDFYEDEKIAAMVEFCKAAKIDDVMFHLNCEELNQAHISIDQTRPWIAVIRKAGLALRDIGVSMSINPWITLLHSDRGRPLNAGQRFKTMVDPCGNAASAVACPMDKDFRRYLTEMYAYYAEAHPRMLWVEDDFRLHNHPPLEWGGCFCENHMAEFSRRAGKTLTREEFVRGILQPGEPHPYRKIWLDVGRETMASLAKEIGEAVARVSPDTQVGLMSSAPCVHCAEGRDWHAILQGLAGEHNPVSRPHLPSYQDATPQNYSGSFCQHTRQTKALIPDNTLIYPELEGFPHTTFIKSNAFTAFQLTTSLLIGSDGITLNLFDMMGNGPVMADGYHQTLADAKDFLNAVKALELTRKNPIGVRVMLNPLSSYYLHTTKGRSMEELYPDEGLFSVLLTAFGISNHYCTDKQVQGQVIAISGQYLRGCTEPEIRSLFEHNAVLLDGEAADILVQRGLGALTDIQITRWHPQDSGTVCYEQVLDGLRYHNLPEGRMSAQNSAGDFLEITCSGAPHVIAEAKNYLGQTTASGMAVIRNKVFILPYGHQKGQHSALLNPIRRDVFQSAVRGFSSYPQVMVCGCAHVSALAWQDGAKTFAALTNWSYDEMGGAEGLSMVLQNIPFEGISELSAQGVRTLQYSREVGSIRVNTGLKGTETKVLIFE